MRAVVTMCIADSGQRLKRWIGVLDDLANAQVMAEATGRPNGPLDGPYEIHQITLELALSVTQAYARAFNRLIDYAIESGFPGIQPELQSVAKYKDIIADPAGMFARMCVEKSLTAAAAEAGTN